MEAKKTFNIHICDDHALITSGLTQILLDTDFVKFVSISNSKEELIKCLNQKNIDLLVLDISVHEINMLDEIVELKVLYPNLKIIALTSYASLDVQREAMSKNINGFLSKDSSNAHIIDACKEVLNGNNFWLSERSRNFQIDKKNILTDELTSREKEILKFIVKGFTNQKIADELNISIHTVQTHRKNLKSKLIVEGVSDMIALAHVHKLI